MTLADLSARERAVLEVLAQRPDLSTAEALAGLRTLDLASGQVRRVLGDLQARDLVVQRLDGSWRVRKRARALLAGEVPVEPPQGPLIADRAARRRSPSKRCAPRRRRGSSATRR